jgi:hypothetical protein
MRAKAAMPSRQSYKPLSSELQMLKAKAAKGAAMCSHGAAAMLPARVAGVPRMVGGAAIRSCYAAGKLLGRLRASMGWGGLYMVSIWEGIFFFIVCGEGEMLVGLVVLVDTCQHGEAGDPGEKSPGGRSAQPFF